jgi:uncharacterized protein YaaR (DUF327 family)
MTDKVARVTLPREVAEAIENVRKRLGWTDEVILHKTYTNGWEAEWAEVLNENGDENKAFLIAQALVNGYEIEKSPEELEAERKEKVREYFDSIHERLYSEELSREQRFALNSELYAVVKTLDLLDIKIPGVNADE